MKWRCREQREKDHGPDKDAARWRLPSSVRVLGGLRIFLQEQETDMSYVDGFVLAVARDKLPAYKEMAQLGATVWMEHGALSYVECLGDDVPVGKLTSFPRAVQAQDDEVVVFSWITYESRAHRDAVNAKVMADPRMKMDPAGMPFDGKRMIFGGFEVLLQR
jgi:uncharacterized protein YbaA (DUF1428 family)